MTWNGGVKNFRGKEEKGKLSCPYVMDIGSLGEVVTKKETMCLLIGEKGALRRELGGRRGHYRRTGKLMKALVCRAVGGKKAGKNVGGKNKIYDQLEVGNHN